MNQTTKRKKRKLKVKKVVSMLELPKLPVQKRMKLAYNFKDKRKAPSPLKRIKKNQQSLPNLKIQREKASVMN